jgi:hypothetical protein
MNYAQTYSYGYDDWLLGVSSAAPPLPGTILVLVVDILRASGTPTCTGYNNN